MTKFQFVSDLLNIINGLLEAGINGCNIHEIRGDLDDLFDNFEEHEGTTCHTTNDRGDLELYAYIIDNLHQTGYELWKEKKTQETKMQNVLDGIEAKSKNDPFCTNQFFQELNDIMNTLPFGMYESEDEPDGTI